MNKKRVDQWIPYAKEAIEKTGIAKNGTVDSKFRSQISSFGAAVVMGSLKASVAFFADRGDAGVDRTKLLCAMEYVICKSRDSKKNPDLKEITAISVLEKVCDPQNDPCQMKAEFIDAAIAIKLALNFFELKKSDEDGERDAES